MNALLVILAVMIFGAVGLAIWLQTHNWVWLLSMLLSGGIPAIVNWRRNRAAKRG